MLRWIGLTSLLSSHLWCAGGRRPCFASCLQRMNGAKGSNWGSQRHDPDSSSYESKAMIQILRLVYPLEGISSLRRKRRTPGTQFPWDTPPQPIIATSWLTVVIQHQLRSTYVSPEYNLPKVFIPQVTPGKGPLVKLICRGLWQQAQHAKCLQWASAELRERTEVRQWVQTWRSEDLWVSICPFIHLLSSTGSTPICSWATFQQLKSRLGSSTPGELFLVPISRFHLLVQTLLQRNSGQSAPFPLPLISKCIILSNMTATWLVMVLHKKNLHLSGTI